MIGPIFILFSCLLWSADLMFRIPLLKKIDSGFIVFFEHAVALILVRLFIKNKNRILNELNKRDYFYLLFIGVFGSALATIFLTASYKFINPSIAILLQKLQPIVTVFGARFILKEKINPNFFIWLILALLGALLLSLQSFNEPFQNTWQKTGVILSVLAAFFWGLSTVYGRSVSLRLDYISTTYYRYFFGMEALAFLLILSQFHWIQNFSSLYLGLKATTLSQATNVLRHDHIALLSILYIAVFSGAIAMSFYYAGLTRTSASNSAIYELFFPLMSVIISWIYLKQPLTKQQLLGGGLLLISGFMVNKTSNVDVQK